MLILSRKQNERLLIGNDGEIKITVVEVRGGKVRIGIEAPKDIPIHREEIALKIAKENQC